VAQAIWEHNLPRFAGDSLPGSAAGLVVGLADRLDTLAGLFAAGLAPTGTKDPFAQRRAALGLVLSLGLKDLDFDLREGLRLAAGELPIASSAESQAACVDFIVGRLRSFLLEQGTRYDIVEAVLAEQQSNPARVFRAARELTQWVARPDWNTILPAYARCVRITRDQKERFTVSPDAFADPAEGEFLRALETAEQAPRKAGSVEDLLTAFLPLIPVINRFFEAVLVMAEEPAVRANRLGLLQRVAALAKGIADFTRLEGF
jgi:glycyl-tRNA synthetase